MSMHCDQCDQGRRCTGACMEHDDPPMGIAGAMLWILIIAIGMGLGMALIYRPGNKPPTYGQRLTNDACGRSC